MRTTGGKCRDPNGVVTVMVSFRTMTSFITAATTTATIGLDYFAVNASLSLSLSLSLSTETTS